MFNKALKYLNANRPEKALPLLKKLAKDTPYKEVLSNLGTAYRMLGNDEAAKECYLKAADRRTPYTNNTFSDVYPVALNNLGLLAYTYEEDDLAEELYKAAIAGDALYADPKWNIANVLLRRYCSEQGGSLELAWKFYEYRKRRSGNPVIYKSGKKLVEWDGISDVSLVILAEQGMGDAFMFGRYIKLAKERCSQVVVQSNPRMAEVFHSMGIETCVDPATTNCTHGIGMCSLGLIFNSEIPSGEWLSEKYIPKTKNSVLDIGVTWSGNSSHVNDRYRSSNSSIFRGLADIGRLYTLNPAESGTAGFTSLKSGNWMETIAELSKLDVVVSVDTSIVHLCGSLGMPCYVITATKNNDWRWGLRSMGMKNVWYPSVKVIRNPGSFSSAIEMVKNDLTN